MHIFIYIVNHQSKDPRFKCAIPPNEYPLKQPKMENGNDEKMDIFIVLVYITNDLKNKA